MLNIRVFALAIVLLFASSLHAKGQADKPAVSREQAAALAQERFPGKIVKVQTENKQYRIRVLQADGRVVTVLVDGQSGRVKRDGI